MFIIKNIYQTPTKFRKCTKPKLSISNTGPHGVVLGTAALASPRHLLIMQILRFPPSLSTQKLGVEPSDPCF